MQKPAAILPRASLVDLTGSAALAGLLVLAAFLSAPLRGADERATVITDPLQVWPMSSEIRALEHPLSIEGRINYYDPLFKMSWIERDGVSTYLQLSANAPALRTGQYVRLEGTLVPNQGLEAGRVTVTVIAEDSPVVPKDTRGRINDLDRFSSQVVVAEGYVDSERYIDADHLRLTLIIENRPVICWVKPDRTNAPSWHNKFIRVTGLYSSRFDPTRTRATIELWVASQENLTVLGTLQEDPRFEIPSTSINELYHQPPDSTVKVRGRVEIHHPGEGLIIRDNTGQVEAHSIQSERVEPGTEVEAVGQVHQEGSWVLEHALFRKVAPDLPAAAPADPAGPLASVAAIRALSQTEAARGREVVIQGMVTWSLPESDVFFLHTIMGSVRVYYDRTKTGVIPYGKYFTVKGVTRVGLTVPGVELREYVDLGSMSHPKARPISYEEAMTGQLDAEWVELRGFLQFTESEGDWRWIHVMTPGGKFVGHLQSPVNFVANPGSLIRVQGVCEVKLGPEGRVADFILRVPFLHDITIEQDAPADPFDLPRRSLDELELLSGGGQMQRVRVAGTVLHQTTSGQVFLADGRSGLRIISTGKQPLQPGDRIEAVGILGREGVNVVLRDALYRRTSGGPAPVPAVLADLQEAHPGQDLKLVSVRGILQDVFRGPQLTRLTLQQGPARFEALLDRSVAPSPDRLKPTAELELTGIYQVNFDDTRQARGFQILLRSPADIRVVVPARLWTLQRALSVAVLLAGLVLVGMGWITALRRQVGQQTEQIRRHMEQQARQEASLQHAARLESLGNLAGGIAHDYNNLLTVILGNLSLLKMDAKLGAAEAGFVAEMERGVNRARDLTKRLLTFARGGDPDRDPVNLEEVVREVVNLSPTNQSTPSVNAESDLWLVLGDRGQLSLVMQNLVANAREASPQGDIRIGLANEHLPCDAPGGLPAGKYVRLTVTDQGPGISAEVMPRIFEPYFTTRKGSHGLGLATVYSIVTKHGGHIKAASAPGHGTTFTVWLPATEKPVAPPEPMSAPPLPVASGQPRVLIMDDEEPIRTISAAVLRRIGVDVTVTTDGDHALREFSAARAEGRPFSLVILDLTIPGGKGGRQTIEAIRKMDPKIPAIVSSGYSNDPVMANYRDYGFQAVVAKPFDVTTLLQVVRRFVPEKPTG